MIKKLSAIFITLLITSCACYGDSSEKLSQQVLVKKPIENSKKIVREINQSVFFETNSFSLNSDTKEILNEEILPAIKGRKVTIEGHCDERGSVIYNQILGKKRAEAVKDYLVRNGADSSKIKTVSYGKSQPLDLDHDKEAWATNRRVVTISTVADDSTF